MPASFAAETSPAHRAGPGGRPLGAGQQHRSLWGLGAIDIGTECSVIYRQHGRLYHGSSCLLWSGASVAPELATMGGPRAQFLFLHHSPERAKNPDAAGPGCVAPAPMCSAHLGQGRLGKEAVELGPEPSCDSRSLSVYTLPGVTT